MEKHVTLVGALHIGYGAFQILGALVAFMFIVGGGLLGGLISKEESVIGITFFIGATVALWVTLVSLPGIVGGIGVLKHKPWARYLVLVVSVLILLNVPLGTGIGAYSMWALAQDDSAKPFGSACC